MTEQKVRIVTHDGGFHADDVFAVAALQLVFGVENCEIVRTRDKELIPTGDWVVDVGFEFDPSQKRFDHHQAAGAGARENGVPYASFGLIWQEVGEQLAGSKEAAQIIDEGLVQSIDAGDNGFQISDSVVEGAYEYSLDKMVKQFYPTRAEESAGVEYDERFDEILSFVRSFLKRELVMTSEQVADMERAHRVYAESARKDLIVFDTSTRWKRVLTEYSDVQLVVSPQKNSSETNWMVGTIQEDYPASLEMRVALPESWRGLEFEELQKASGVPDAVFCHKTGFMAVAGSKEGAIALAEKALASG